MIYSPKENPEDIYNKKLDLKKNSSDPDKK